MKLAETEAVRQGVVAAQMGEKLYLSLNYSKLADTKARDDADPSKQVVVGILRYEPETYTNESQIQDKSELWLSKQAIRGWSSLEMTL